MRILYFGSDLFSLFSLQAVHLRRPQKLLVVAKPGCPVYKFSNENDIPTRSWPIAENETSNFDLGIVVSFGQLIPSYVIDTCKYGMVNVHPSLLPRWRGSSPLIHTILNNDSVTGVSLITVAKNKFDVGDIIRQEVLPENPQNLTLNSLQDLTAALGARMLCEFLDDVEGNLNKAKPQSSEGVTFARKVTPEMTLVDWSQTTQQLDCLRRSVGLFKHLTTFYGGEKIKVSLMPKIVSSPSSRSGEIVEESVPGFLHYHKKHRRLDVRCGDGWVGIDNLTFVSKRTISGQDFFSGYLQKSGSCKMFTGKPFTPLVDGSSRSLM